MYSEQQHQLSSNAHSRGSSPATLTALGPLSPPPTPADALGMRMHSDSRIGPRDAEELPHDRAAAR